MFIKSMMETTVSYYKNDFVIKLKPNAVTEVDENLVSYKELKDCYGDRIYIIDLELLGEDEEDTSSEKSTTIDDNSNDLTQDEADFINLEITKKFAEDEEAINTIVNSDNDLKKGFLSDVLRESTNFGHALDNASVLEEVEKRYNEYNEVLKNNEITNSLEGKIDELPKEKTEITEKEIKDLKEKTPKPTKEEKTKPNTNKTTKTSKSKTNSKA